MTFDCELRTVYQPTLTPTFPICQKVVLKLVLYNLSYRKALINKFLLNDFDTNICSIIPKSFPEIADFLLSSRLRLLFHILNGPQFLSLFCPTQQSQLFWNQEILPERFVVVGWFDFVDFDFSELFFPKSIKM